MPPTFEINLGMIVGAHWELRWMLPCRERISLSSSRRGVTYEALLDGSIAVAVKCLNIPKGEPV